MKKLTIGGKFTLLTKKINNEAVISEVLMTVLSTPKNGMGSDTKEMGEIIDLIRKLDKGITEEQDTILIENGEHAALCGCLKAFKFAVNDPALYDWIKSIENLPDVDIKEAV